MEYKLPEILAPAGDEDCFLAALAAGADAVYLGLKQFSARMEAENFGLAQLARLVELAHASQRRVYVAMNTLIKPNEVDQAWRLICRLEKQAHVDGLIIQDLGLVNLAKQAGFTGQIAFSTLANVSNPLALEQARGFGANRVIIPRELSLAEMRIMNDACPPDLGLECFVHGALCYCVSGRCYWSSYLGGKSSLRGRCVQPCRRNYTRQNEKREGRDASRYFSCQDLELGAATSALLGLSRIISWKIEGRKKGPHYVFHTVSAYRLLRDNPDDAEAKNMALQFLNMALGRPGVKARFSRPVPPMAPGKQTSSGRLAGKIAITQTGGPVFKPRFDLLPKDYLRIGVEDEHWHATLPVKKSFPKGSAFSLNLAKHKTPKAGTPVFLIDRREAGLEKLLSEWRKKLKTMPEETLPPIQGKPQLPVAAKPHLLKDMVVRRAGRQSSQFKSGRHLLNALWLSANVLHLSRPMLKKTAFWLPPDLWPDNEPQIEKLVRQLWQTGCRHFVCNAPWQRGLFPAILPEDANLVAGPFCNIANGCAVAELDKAGFKAAFASPELSEKNILELPAQSPLPLGVALEGFWPVGLSRFGLAGLTAGDMFKSPMGELFWTRNYGGTIWIYPAWPLNLSQKRQQLLEAGYSFFAFLHENPPASLPEKKRPGLFNWEGALL